jgi:hypothetical protein
MFFAAYCISTSQAAAYRQLLLLPDALPVTAVPDAAWSAAQLPALHRTESLSPAYSYVHQYSDVQVRSLLAIGV